MNITVTDTAVTAPLWFWLIMGGATILLLLYLFWYSLYIERTASELSEQNMYVWESLRTQWVDDDDDLDADDPADVLWKEEVRHRESASPELSDL